MYTLYTHVCYYSRLLHPLFLYTIGVLQHPVATTNLKVLSDDSRPLLISSALDVIIQTSTTQLQSVTTRTQVLCLPNAWRGNETSVFAYRVGIWHGTSSGPTCTHAYKYCWLSYMYIA